MFERYTRAARQTIFHARDEALKDNAAEVGPVHLLRGAELADREAADRFLAEHPELALLRETRPVPGPAPDPKDIKLSTGSKRALAWAAESSKKQRSRTIGASDLLAGALRAMEEPPARPAERLSIKQRWGCIVERLRGVR